MHPRYYFDTSIFGGVFDAEFEYETRILFNRIEIGEIMCVYSALAEVELERAPERVIKHFQDLNAANLEKIEVNEAILTLTRKYIEENVVGLTSLDDCVHIALATFYEVDMLIS